MMTGQCWLRSWDQRTRMKDGLYQVTTARLCAWFLVENGLVTMCAPILRKKLQYWMARATLVEAPNLVPGPVAAQIEAS